MHKRHDLFFHCVLLQKPTQIERLLSKFQILSIPVNNNGEHAEWLWPKWNNIVKEEKVTGFDVIPIFKCKHVSHAWCGVGGIFESWAIYILYLNKLASYLIKFIKFLHNFVQYQFFWRFCKAQNWCQALKWHLSYLFQFCV